MRLDWTHSATGRSSAGVYSVQGDKWSTTLFRAYWKGAYLPGRHQFTSRGDAIDACQRHEVLCDA